MSQLVKAIIAVDTGERKHIPKGLSPLFVDVFSGKSEWSTTYDEDIAKVYKIGVTLGCSATVSESTLIREGSTPLEEAVNRCKKQIIEAVFGEFRQDFRRIEKAIYDHNAGEAGRLLYEMEGKMYGTD